MVDLHRADVRLSQANAIAIPGVKGFSNLDRVPFRLFCLRLLTVKKLVSKPLQEIRSGEDCLLNDTRRNLRKLYFEDPDRAAQSSEMRRVTALANDAMRFLDRAEPVLLERRRNVWWNTWFF